METDWLTSPDPLPPHLKKTLQATPPLPPAPGNKPGCNDFGWRWWSVGQQDGRDRILKSVGTTGVQ